MTRPRFSRFLVVWAGQLVSGLGTGMTGFALGIHVFSKSQSAAEFGLVIAALFVPGILLRPLGGLLADRYDRRLTIVVGDLGSAIAVLYLLVSLGAGELSSLQIYLAVAFNSGFSALQSPAYRASVTDLLGEEEYARAGGLMQLASAAQHLLSPLAAGMLLHLSGVRTILLIDVATFVVAVAAVVAIGTYDTANRTQDNRRHRPSIGVQLREGFQSLRTDRQAFGTVLIISLVTFFVGLLQTLFAPMVLHLTDSRTLGLIQSISASGMVLCSLLIGFRRLPFAPQKSLSYGLLVAGIMLALMGVRTDLVWITVTFFVFYFCLPLVNTGAEVSIRKAIPNELQGRAWGIIGLLSQLGYVTAYLLGGLVADTIFEPLLMPEGGHATTLGTIWGLGPGRGIAMMLSLAGVGLTAAAVVKAYSDSRCPALHTTQGACES